jgi:hypothetical protein
MAEVFAPLLSIAATGDIGDSLNFSCGETVRKKKTVAPKETPARKVVNETWKAGCDAWSANGDLFFRLWDAFWKWHMVETKCDIPKDTPLHGFKAFMKYYIKLGVDGWTNYPDPPEVSPKYPVSYFPWELEE